MSGLEIQSTGEIITKYDGRLVEDTKWNMEYDGQNMDILSMHNNEVNYIQLDNNDLKKMFGSMNQYPDESLENRIKRDFAKNNTRRIHLVKNHRNQQNWDNIIPYNEQVVELNLPSKSSTLKTSAKKSSTPKSSAKKSSTPRSSAKNSSAKNSSAKKSSTPRSSAKKTSAKKSSTPKSSAKKSSAKKSSAKKSSVNKSSKRKTKKNIKKVHFETPDINKTIY
jgi:hypothetical protein